ncbi:MAG: DedA family protein [Phycisphaerales bacterium]
MPQWSMDFGPLIQTYGPFAVFFLLMLSGVGVPLGEDIIIIPAGVLIGHGKLAFWPTLLLAYAGVVLADTLWFYLCAKFGTRLLHKRWFKRMVHPKRLLQAKHQIEVRGSWFMVIARFVPGTRTTAITVAGLLHMATWKFVVIELICVAITAPLQIGVGMLIAHGMGSADDASLLFWLIGIMVVIALIPVMVGWIIRYRASRSEPPRARARWLRRFRLKRKTTHEAEHPAKRDKVPAPDEKM